MVTASDVPPLGLGTYRNDEHDQCVTSVMTALDIGYRHIDTAEAYGNEEAVGEAIAQSDVPRSDVFIGTKVLHPKLTDSYEADAIVRSGRACLDRLGVEPVELFYGIHWPGGYPVAYDVHEVARACEQLADEGAFERFGVCNLTIPLIDEVRDATDLTIEAIQVEMHPLLPQEELRAYCDEHDMTLVAYGPLGNGQMFEVPELTEIAEKHDVSVARVCLAWLLEKDVAPIPKAVGRAHLEDNWRALDFELEAEDIEAIDAIDRQERIYQPDYSPNW